MVQPEPDRTPPKVSRPPPSAGRCTPCRARRRAPGAVCGSPAGPAPAPAPAKQRTAAYESTRDKGRTLGTLNLRVLPRTSARWTTTLHEAQPAHSSGMLVPAVFRSRAGSAEEQREAARPVIAGDAASLGIDRGQGNGRDGIRLTGRLPTPFFPDTNRSTRQ